MPLERNGGDPAEDFWRGGILHTVSQRQDNRIVPRLHPTRDFRLMTDGRFTLRADGWPA